MLAMPLSRASYQLPEEGHLHKNAPDSLDQIPEALHLEGMEAIYRRAGNMPTCNVLDYE